MTSPGLIPGLLALSIALSFASWGRRILFPFQIFTTWVHESFHALAATLLGGSKVRITIDPDGSGLTFYRIQRGRVREAVIASAGYLGASATGCLILRLTVHSDHSNAAWSAPSLALCLSGLVLLSILVWIRNGFGVVSALVLALGLGILFYLGSRFAYPVLLFLGIQTALNALLDIRVLFALGASRGAKSDAHTMQKLLILPYWFWAFLWLALSLGMIFFTWRSLPE